MTLDEISNSSEADNPVTPKNGPDLDAIISLHVQCLRVFLHRAVWCDVTALE